MQGQQSTTNRDKVSSAGTMSSSVKPSGNMGLETVHSTVNLTGVTGPTANHTDSSRSINAVPAIPAPTTRSAVNTTVNPTETMDSVKPLYQRQ